MTVYINDSLITEQPDTCKYTAYLEGQCDALEMVFDDSEKAISSLGLVKGDTVQVIEGNIDTGEMYISGIDYTSGQAAIRALSLPLSAFVTDNKLWENVSLTAVIKDVMKKTGLKVEFIDKPNFNYKALAQVEECPIKFIADKLMLEGFGIRVNHGTAYIFDEKKLETGQYDVQMTAEDFESAPEYSTKDAKLISQVENTYITPEGKQISTTQKSGIQGKILRLSMAVDTVGASIRFSNGMMRAANKYEYLAKGTVQNLDHAPGDIIYISDAPKGHTGENIIYTIKNDIVGNTQTLLMRRPIEGDY